MGTTIHMLIPPLSFIILNYLSYKKDLFKGIENENSKGTIYYPVSVFVMALITFYHPEFYIAFGIGTFCMGIGDGFAPLVAGYLKSRQIINNKTLTGTATVFGATLVIVLVFKLIFGIDFNIFKLIIIATSAALLELVGINGLDNLYVPLGVSAITYLLGVV
jgi:phytol kinase